MDLFPIGSLSANSDTGTIDSITYSFFEPNNGCISNRVYNTLVTQFYDQTMLARKKALPHLTLQYTYDNIWDREFRQIEHFIDEMEDALNPFWVIDLSKGSTPTSVTDSGGDWVVAITNTQLYSTTANMKAHRAFVYNGVSWKEGPVTSINTNTNITIDVDTSDYGNLALATANLDSIVYPMYEVYVPPNILQNFRLGPFIDEDRGSTSVDGGFMRSGTVSFISKYKV